MAGAITMFELQKRLNRLESQQAIVNKTVKELGSKFAWFWWNDRVRIFAIVTAVSKKGTANLVGFSDGLSGGVLVESDVEMFVHNPMLEDDEQVRAGKWEPILDLSLIIDQIIEISKKAEPKKDEPEEKEAEADDDNASSTEATPAA